MDNEVDVFQHQIIINEAKVDSYAEVKKKAVELCQNLIKTSELQTEIDMKGIEDLIFKDFTKNTLD